MSRSHGLIRAVVVVTALLLSGAAAVARAEDPLDNAPLAPQSPAQTDTGAKGPTDATSSTGARARPKPKPEFIFRTAAEWRKILTKFEFAVTREKATEPPFTGKYATGHYRGTFVCVCCDAAHVESDLFSSRAKFDSGTGWPSFFQPFNNTAVRTAMDYGALEPRVEVMCRRCGAHLGHVFDDGPPPTGLRFCINSAAIRLKAPGAETNPKAVNRKTSTKSKANAKAKSATSPAPKTSQPKEARSHAESDSADTAGNAKGQPPSS